MIIKAKLIITRLDYLLSYNKNVATHSSQKNKKKNVATHEKVIIIKINAMKLSNKVCTQEQNDRTTIYL